MYKHLIDILNLRHAFFKVKANKGCPGIDHTSIARFEQNLGRNLGELARLLAAYCYKPLPAKEALILKPNGKTRTLGIPAVRDSVVQQALLKELESYLEPQFTDSSFGFRPQRNAHDAISRVQKYLDDGYEYVVDADIRDFFGTLNHQILMAKLRRYVPDSMLGRLVFAFLKAGVMAEGRIRTQTAGTPQGGIISPILANLYLNDFDQSIGKTYWKLVRYADDFVILCKSVHAACQAMKTTRNIMRKLKLELAEEKTRVTDYASGFEFLGYRFQNFHGNKRWPTDKAVQAVKEKLRYLTRRQQPLNIVMFIPKLNPLIRGWGNYFRYGSSKTRFAELDGWIRMRLRSFIEKKKWPSGMNWKYPNDHFASFGLVSLVSLLTLPTGRQLSLAISAQPCRRAVCGKSARTVR